MHEALRNMSRVLRRLGYTRDKVVELKGRVACELNTADELMLTEMLFNGVFQDLSVPQTAALLACMIHEEKDEEDVRVRDDMQPAVRQLQETAQRLARVMTECGIATDATEYAQNFKVGMIDVIHAWASGAKFSELFKLTRSFAGSIVRLIRRLEELLRQLCVASRAMGNAEMEHKFSEVTQAIKRDIVFSASLYL